MLQPGQAAENWDLCQIPSYRFVENDSLALDDTSVEAQSIVGENENELRMSGDVIIDRRPGRRAPEYLSR